MAKAADIVAGCCFLFAVLGAAVLLVVAFVFVIPLQVTVDEAYLGRLALAAPGNGTPASLAYDLSLVVVLHNHDWALSVRRTAPLDAELRFAGRPFARVRMAGAMDWDRIRRSTKAIYRFAVADEAALGSIAAAEFAREKASGVFSLELSITGRFRYQAHDHSHILSVICPLQLSISTPTMPAPFARAGQTSHMCKWRAPKVHALLDERAHDLG
ncbi:hypothetical protein EJB05_42292, partial [Eragrostis curvula]